MGTHKINADLDVSGEVQGTSLDINGAANISDHLVVKGTTSSPLSSLFSGSLVVQGAGNEDPIIAVTDVNTTNAAAGVFHQSAASPGFPALVVQAHSNGNEQPLISARTNVNNTTGVGGTEVFKVDGDGDGEFNGSLTATSLDINGNADISGTLKIGSGATVSTILDEDAMGSNSATALATQQSIKAYVTSSVSAAGGGDVTLSGSQTFTGVKTFGTTTKLQFRDSAAYINQEMLLELLIKMI